MPWEAGAQGGTRDARVKVRLAVNQVLDSAGGGERKGDGIVPGVSVTM